MIKKRTSIAVIGSGSEPHSDLSAPLGRALAEEGYDLINGGGGGVMHETARAFAAVEKRKGIVIGVLPASHPCDAPDKRENYASPPGYPNAFTELAIRTHLPLSGAKGKDTASRNHIIVLTADFIVALPGSEGTRSEIELALEYGKPLVLLSPNGQWQEYAGRAALVETVDQAVAAVRKHFSASA